MSFTLSQIGRQNKLSDSTFSTIYTNLGADVIRRLNFCAHGRAYHRKSFCFHRFHLITSSMSR